MVPLHAAALATSALLLFWLQLLFARQLLPPFGGTPAVWAGCLVFYQAALLAGYGWAHALGRLPHRAQPVVHIVALAAAAILLPPLLPPDWEPSGHPLVALLSLLATRIGAPLVLISATAPLLQSWYARLGRADSADPYPLYAASNAGSIVALVAYPLVAQPLLGSGGQGTAWAIGYVLLAATLVACGAVLFARGGETARPGNGRGDAGAARAAPTARDRVRWLCLCFVPAALLYGVTGVVTTDLAPVPLLWVIPLGLYLLSWVLAFGRRRLVPRHVVALGVPPLVVVLVVSSLLGWFHPAGVVLTLHLAGFFAIAWLFHRDLAALRPAAAHLSGFYVAIAAGGLAAGIYGGIGAPLVYTGTLEYPVMLVVALALLPPEARDAPGATALARTNALAAALLASACLAGFAASDLGANLPGLLLVVPLLGAVAWSFERGRRRAALGLALALLVAQCALSPPVLHRERSFFGVHRVVASRDGAFLHYMSGTTEHGRQRTDPDRRREPLAYYFPTAPIGRAFAALGARARPPERVAVLGLGVGGLAAWARAGQRWRFYEIDPSVERIARDPRWFTFIAHAPADVEVSIGDARLSLRDEARADAPKHDVIALDAFTSDAVPVHLLTREAFDLYLARLAPGGVLVVNVSNRFLDLEAVVAALARDLGLAGIVERQATLTPSEEAAGKTRSHAIVLARDAEDIADISAASPTWRALVAREAVAAWTDDRSAIVPILRLR